MKMMTKMLSAVASCAIVALMVAGCSSSPVNSESSPKVAPSSTHEQWVQDARVRLDGQGSRYFPKVSRNEALDAEWARIESAYASQGRTAPEKPDSPAEVKDDQGAWVRCMHDDGWSDTDVSSEGIVTRGEFSLSKPLEWSVSEYGCSAKFTSLGEMPNERQASDFWQFQKDVVIPCLEKQGVTIAGFPSKEEYLDRYFSDGSLELASAYATGDVQQRLLEGKLECRVLPEGWDYSV